MMNRTLLIIGLCSFVFGCGQVDYIEVEPSILTLKQRNNSVWMRARAMSYTGNHSPKARIVWSVKDESIAKVDATGKLTPVKSGRTEIIATHGKVQSTVPVEVLF